MMTATIEQAAEPKRKIALRPMRSPKAAPLAVAQTAAKAALSEAHDAGLLDGEKTRHLSFRAPDALVEAARRATGLNSTTELGLAGLAMLAQPDPFAAVFKQTEGALGSDHTLEY